MPYPTYYQGYPYQTTSRPEQQYIPQNAPQSAPSFPAQSMMPAPMQTPQQGYISRPVTSREEALAVQTDFLSPGTLMPDMAHGVIYLKRFNTNTGASDFFEFHLYQPEAEPAVQYATLDQLNALREEIERLKKPVRKAAKNDDADE